METTEADLIFTSGAQAQPSPLTLLLSNYALSSLQKAFEFCVTIFSIFERNFEAFHEHFRTGEEAGGCDGSY
jgi:hypothetical protein